MNESAQPKSTRRARKGGKPAPVHFVLNWGHMSVFMAVAAIGLVSLNQGFAGIDRRIDDMSLRFDDMNQRMDERFENMNQRMDERFNGVDRRIDRVETRLGGVETRLGGVEGELSGMNARLSVVEHIVGAQANSEAEFPSVAETPDSDL